MHTLTHKLTHNQTHFLKYFLRKQSLYIDVTLSGLLNEISRIQVVDYEENI